MGGLEKTLQRGWDLSEQGTKGREQYREQTKGDLKGENDNGDQRWEWWRQRGTHTGGKGSLTLWVHCDYIVIIQIMCPAISQWGHVEFFYKVPVNLITICPVGPCWAHCKSAHQSGHWVLFERTLWFLSQFCSQCVLLCTWANHWEFFQHVLSYVIKMCPEGSFWCILNVFSIWLNFTTNSQRNHWVYS